MEPWEYEAVGAWGLGNVELWGYTALRIKDPENTEPWKYKALELCGHVMLGTYRSRRREPCESGE